MLQNPVAQSPVCDIGKREGKHFQINLLYLYVFYLAYKLCK